MTSFVKQNIGTVAISLLTVFLSLITAGWTLYNKAEAHTDGKVSELKVDINNDFQQLNHRLELIDSKVDKVLIHCSKMMSSP